MPPKRNSDNNGPPPEEPPGDPPEDQGQPEDEDPQAQAAEWIRLIVINELDKREERIDERFARIDEQFQQVASALNTLNNGLLSIQEHLSGAQANGHNGHSNGNEQTETQQIAPQEQPPPPMPAGTPAATLITGILQTLSNPNTLTGLVDNWVKVKQNMRPVDVDQYLQYVYQTNPQKFLAYVPDPLGGRFPEIISKAVETGIRIGVSGKGGASPLVNPNIDSSGGPSGDQPAPSSPPTATGASLSLEDLSNEQIDDLTAELVKLKLTREAA